MSNPSSFSIRSDVQTSDAIVNGNLQVQGNQTVQGSLTQGSVSHQQAVGYSNTDTFLTGSGTITNLNTAAGQTAAAGTALQLPVGSYLKQVTLIATSAVVGSGASADIGTGVATVTTSAGFFDGVDIDNATAGTGLGTTGNYLVNTQPTVGSTFTAEPVEVAATGSPAKLVLASLNFVTVEIKSAALTAGSIKVVIDYDIIY